MYSSTAWSRLAGGRSVKVSPLGDPVDAEFVQFIDRKVDPQYGEYYQDDREMSVIFKVGDRYFKKFGEKSSYGDESWDGEVVEVFPTTKTIQVFE